MSKLSKYNMNEKLICPAACEKAKCIHDLHITKCKFCVNRLSLKRPPLVQKQFPKNICKHVCESYNCTNLESCKYDNKGVKNFKECPIDCRNAACLKKAKKNPNEEIPLELIPCICHSDELWEFSGGPVTTCGYSTSIYRHGVVFEIGTSHSRIAGSTLFEVILREPACEKNDGWNKKFTKSTQMDGSIYEGTKNELGFAGEGKLRLPHGVTYNGEFDQGKFHGKGILTYPTGVSVEGVWEKGKNIAIHWIRFPDGLKYKESDWKYLSPPDRRFYPEYTEGLQSECSLYRTGQLPTQDLPEGTYDSGDGYYSPIDKCIYDYDTNERIRIPCVNEVEWIEKNCRYGWRETIGNSIN